MSTLHFLSWWRWWLLGIVLGHRQRRSGQWCTVAVFSVSSVHNTRVKSPGWMVVKTLSFFILIDRRTIRDAAYGCIGLVILQTEAQTNQQNTSSPGTHWLQAIIWQITRIEDSRLLKKRLSMLKMELGQRWKLLRVSGSWTPHHKWDGALIIRNQVGPG